MITIGDVRNFLNNLSEQRVPSPTIQKQIGIANSKIYAIKSSQAPTKTVENAILLYASWLTYGAYATDVERTTGGLPPQVATHLALLERLSQDFITLISRGAPTYSQYPPVAQPETLLDQYVGGNLSEDYY